MNEAARKVDPGALVTGIVLIAVGVTFLIGDFGDLVRNWWPMIIVLVGIPKLLNPRTIWSGLWLIGFGVWLQMIRFHLFGMTYRSAWPLLLIFVGASIAVRALVDVGGREEHREP